MYYKELYTNKPEPIMIHVVQGSNAVPMYFKIVDWEIPAGATANFYLLKPSGLKVYNAGTISDNTCIVNMTTQMTAEVGVNYGQLEIIKSGAVYRSWVVEFRVLKTIIDNSAIESQDEFTALEQALSDVSNFVTRDQVASMTVAQALKAVSDGNGLNIANNYLALRSTASTNANNITSIGIYQITKSAEETGANWPSQYYGSTQIYTGGILCVIPAGAIRPTSSTNYIMQIWKPSGAILSGHEYDSSTALYVRHISVSGSDSTAWHRIGTGCVLPYYQEPEIYNNRVSITNGGYYQEEGSYLVNVHMQITAAFNTTGTFDNIRLFKNFPPAYFRTALTAYNLDNHCPLAFYIGTEGGGFIGVNGDQSILGAQDEIVISGFYYAANLK